MCLYSREAVVTYTVKASSPSENTQEIFFYSQQPRALRQAKLHTWTHSHVINPIWFSWGRIVGAAERRRNITPLTSTQTANLRLQTSTVLSPVHVDILKDD